MCEGKIKDKELRENGSGYSDPTAYTAICKVTNECKLRLRNRNKDVSDMMSIIKRILDIMDFRLEGRLVLVDKQTGIKYK